MAVVQTAQSEPRGGIEVQKTSDAQGDGRSVRDDDDGGLARLRGYVLHRNADPGGGVAARLDPDSLGIPPARHTAN